MTTRSEAALILAPLGRDASVAAAMLAEKYIESRICADIPAFVAGLEAGAAFGLVTEEALLTADIAPIARWLAVQPEWSDFPFILLTHRGGGLERNPAAARYLKTLGNVTFLERPFHPLTLVSVAEAALRARRRQYDARSRLEAIAFGEQRLKVALAAGGLGNWTLDATTFELVASDDCKAHYGRRPEEGFTYVDLRDSVHPDDAARMQAAVAHSQATGEDYDIGYRAVWPDGSIHWVAVNGRVEYNRHGAMVRMVGVSRDITETRAAEERLRESERRYRALFEGIDEGFAIFEFFDGPNGPLSDYFVVETNPAYDRHSGLSDVVGKTIYEIVGDEAESWIARYQPVLVTGEPIRFEQELITTGRWLELSSFRIEPAERNQVAVVFQDISARKVAEAELRALNGELETRVDQRTRENERVMAQLHEAQKLETLGQLTGGVAHDFNNLLTPIMGTLDLLKRRLGSDDRYGVWIENALQSAERARTLVKRLLGFARRTELERTAIDPRELIEGMRELIDSSLGGTIEVEFDIARDLPAALGDAGQLELALLNLCVNARDAMPDGGKLRLTAQCKAAGPSTPAGLEGDRFILIRVIDTGTGMSPETLQRAIEPFYSTKDVGRGTGLGLSMVHGLAAQLGGAFELRSALGRGTEARLWLQVSDQHPVERTQVPRSAPAEEPHAALAILLVDDEPLVRMGTAAMLRELGHEVTEATGGRDALDRMDEGLSPDLVITDYKMPGMDGAEFARVLRETAPATSVLMITGYAGGDDAASGLPRLAKPFGQAEMAQAIAAVTGGTQAGATLN